MVPGATAVTAAAAAVHGVRTVALSSSASSFVSSFSLAKKVSLPIAASWNKAARSYRLTTSCKSTGQFFVGGNWKCNGTRDSVAQLVDGLNVGSVPDDVEIVVAPPFIYLDQAINTLSPRFQISAQNAWIKNGGAFTGEISAEMLRDIGLNWVILGHSERRALCGESNEVVATKERYALDNGLNVIGCIGETETERVEGRTLDVVFAQLAAMADAISVEDWARVVIAYEPVWAIGTGKTATPADAQEVHSGIRRWLAENVSAAVSAGTRIIYGGSVTDANCDDLARENDVDGFLVGGASLKAPTFIRICNATASLKSAV